MGKYYDIDPDTCSIEELESTIKHLEQVEEFYEGNQQATKRAINQMYGVFGAVNAYNLANTKIAESITLQGQDLIKFSVVQINDYFRNMWKDDKVAHEKTVEIMKRKYPDFDGEKFKQLAGSANLSFDTLQRYGDSVTGDTLIWTTKGRRRIDDIFDSGVGMTISADGKERVVSDALVYSVKTSDISDVMYKVMPVEYVMRHKTNKKIYRVTADTGDFVDVTEDHAIIVYSKGLTEAISKRPVEICDDDRVIVNVGNVAVMSRVVSVKPIEAENVFVYDIAVAYDKDFCHNFIANNIAVHNTDSVDGASIIITEKHPDGISIEDFYKENSNNKGDVTLAGHESVHTDDKALNVKHTVEYSPVKRIIRHKVSKPKWKLRTKSGKEVICTGDHSLVVVRDGRKITIKPDQIKKGDSIISVL